jgi:hypothetical protein
MRSFLDDFKATKIRPSMVYEVCLSKNQEKEAGLTGIIPDLLMD